MLSPDDILHRFAYHPPKDEETKDLHATIRAACRLTAEEINESCPDGREKALAITKMEEAMMWANAAIARNPNASTTGGRIDK